MCSLLKDWRCGKHGNLVTDINLSKCLTGQFGSVGGSRLKCELSFLPMKALGMVIFSHIRSRTSRPDSGLAIALTTAVMSLWMVSWLSSWTPEKHHIAAVMGRPMMNRCCGGWWESYHSVGGDSLSWRQCATPRQRGRLDELARLRECVVRWRRMQNDSAYTVC